ncbi:RNA polymerase-binding protein RbpA [Pseudoclavibacter sp. 13-3]|uniref:RNA polymerase-binding protein RbpA n=1 Tax=Pseudoclavibacter sp. 13-3 TaxID=2901228 RepID=UPI002F909698
MFCRQTRRGHRMATKAASSKTTAKTASKSTAKSASKSKSKAKTAGKKKGEPASQRTPWDMLLERRSESELKEILDERLDYLHDRRKRALELSRIKSDPNEQ